MHRATTAHRLDPGCSGRLALSHRTSSSATTTTEAAAGVGALDDERSTTAFAFLEVTRPHRPGRRLGPTSTPHPPRAPHRSARHQLRSASRKPPHHLLLIFAVVLVLLARAETGPHPLLGAQPRVHAIALYSSSDATSTSGCATEVESRGLRRISPTEGHDDDGVAFFVERRRRRMPRLSRGAASHRSAARASMPERLVKKQLAAQLDERVEGQRSRT